MSTAAAFDLIDRELAGAELLDAQVTDDALIVELTDGRILSVPLIWYPRLWYGTPEERANFRVTRDGIHWPDLDEDIGVRGLLLGRQSSESQQSLKRWLGSREQRLAA